MLFSACEDVVSIVNPKAEVDDQLVEGIVFLETVTHS
jgi:hypothetical protein